MKILCVMIGVCKKFTPKEPMETRHAHRLSKDGVIPVNYELYLRLSEDEFSGRVRIEGKAPENTTEVILNSKGLIIEKGVLEAGKRRLDLEAEHKGEILTFRLPESVSGKVYLEVEYKGEYSTDMEGLYKSTWKDKVTYSTHFEPTGARRVFPCFDQPDMKATFDVAIEAPKGHAVLSNGEIKEVRDGVHIFEKTPKMSTYILALVVGEFKYLQGMSRGNKRIRVYALPPEHTQGEYGLDVAIKCLDFFESYFGIEYPFSKLDLVGIPSFAMGAMENWGLVTFRTSSLLYDESTTSIRSKKNIANTICHELAHMWFGNLVTMEWWNDLWLNEGFATWAAALAVKELELFETPGSWNDFLVDEVESGMDRDSLKSTHSVSINVENPDEIDQLFDEISYNKGASIIRMLEDWMTPLKFRDGLRKYLADYSYGSATTETLWKTLEESSDLVVAKIIGPWTSQKGFPLLEVKDNGEELQITQRPFALGYEPENTLWPVPLIIRWDNGKITKIIMNSEVINIKKQSRLYKLNLGFNGFFRVLYDGSVYSELFGGLFSGNMSSELSSDVAAADRLNILCDGMILSVGGYSTEFDFDNLKFLRFEPNHHVLSKGIGMLRMLASIFYNDAPRRAYFMEKMREIVGKRVVEIDFEVSTETSVNDASVKALLIGSAVFLKDPHVLDMLRKVGMSSKTLKEIPLHPSFIRYAYIALADKRFDDLMEVYREGLSPQQRTDALVALASAESPENIKKLLASFKDIRLQDSMYVFAILGMHMKMRDTAAEFFIDNFDMIKSVINNNGLLRHCLEYALSHIFTPGLSEKVDVFLEAQVKDHEMESAANKCIDERKKARDIRERVSSWELK